MKKIILSIAISAISITLFAQNSQNLYISEILVNAPGYSEPFPDGVTRRFDDGFAEYIELRGTPGSTIEDGTYIVTIEGDTEATGGNPQNPGDIDRVLDLSGLAIGANGFLVLLRDGHSYTIDPMANIDTVVLENASTSASGRLEDQTVSIFLITSAIIPTTSDDIDDDNDGLVDGTVFSSWTILDQIALMDDDGRADGIEASYASVTIVEKPDQSTENIIVPVGSVIIGSNQPLGYAARVGASTGATAADWVGGEVNGTFPNYNLGDDSNPIDYDGQLLDHIGSANRIPQTLSTPKFTKNNLVISNPVSGVFQIDGNSSSLIHSIQVLNTLGQTIYVQNTENRTIDLTSASQGLYFLSINGSNDLIKIMR